MNPSENATHDRPAITTDEGMIQSCNHLIAPVWHTVVLVVTLLGFSLSTAHSHRVITAQRGRVVLYAATIVWEWLLVGFIFLGIRRRGVRMRELIGGRWASISDFSRDAGISVLFWLVAMLVLALMGYAMGLSNPNAAADARQKLDFMIPQSTAELALFLGVSGTAGFCEEIIFRGYLQRQFAALARSQVVAVILQGIVFGAGHGYQGGARMALIAVYGVMFGLLAMWRGNLRPGMLAHGLHDGIQGVLLRTHLLR